MIRYSANGVLFLNLGDFEHKYSYGLYSYNGVGEYPNARRVPCDFMHTIECSRNERVIQKISGIASYHVCVI